MWKEMTRMHPNQQLDTLISQIILNKIQQFADFLYIQAVQKATKHSTPADTAPQFLQKLTPFIQFFLLSAKQFLRCCFSEFGIGSPNNPLQKVLFSLLLLPGLSVMILLQEVFLLDLHGNLRVKFSQPFYFYPKVINK